MSTTVIDYESEARVRKAAKLCTVFHRIALKSDHTDMADMVSRLDDDGWLLAAEIAKVIKPSAKTRQLVIDALRRAQTRACEAHTS